MATPIRLKNFPIQTPVTSDVTVFGYNPGTDNDVQFSLTTLATYLSTLYATSSHSHTEASGSVAGFLSAANFTKLSGIATGATANSPDATLLDRANHTGTQTSATISDFAAEVRAQLEAALVAGSNVTLTPGGSGATRTLTVASTGSGGGGGAGGVRAATSETINLAEGATGETTITLGKTCIIQSITISQAGTVVIYNSVAARANDSNRAFNIAPTNEAGIIAQITASAPAVLTRSVPASNAEIPITAIYPVKIKNNGPAGNVTITVGYINLEA